MPAELHTFSAQLRAEALGLLDEVRGTIEAALGPVAIAGSVDFDLMVWRDLDLYTQAPPEARDRFVPLAAQLYERLAHAGHVVVKASFNDEYLRPGNAYGQGLYVGLLVLCNGRAPAWKIDLWGWDAATYRQKMAEHVALATALRGVDRDTILRIKHAVHSRREYRDTLTSMDVYGFVLARAGTSVEEFDAFVLRKRHGAS